MRLKIETTAEEGASQIFIEVKRVTFETWFRSMLVDQMFLVRDIYSITLNWITCLLNSKSCDKQEIIFTDKLIFDLSMRNRQRGGAVKFNKLWVWDSKFWLDFLLLSFKAQQFHYYYSIAPKMPTSKKGHFNLS